MIPDHSGRRDLIAAVHVDCGAFALVAESVAHIRPPIGQVPSVADFFLEVAATARDANRNRAADAAEQVVDVFYKS